MSANGNSNTRKYYSASGADIYLYNYAYRLQPRPAWNVDTKTDYSTSSGTQGIVIHLSGWPINVKRNAMHYDAREESVPCKYGPCILQIRMETVTRAD